MTKTIAAIGISLTSLTVMAYSTIESSNSFDVVNIGNQEKTIWVNGIEYSMKSDSAIRVPCIAGEALHVEINEALSLRECGEIVEVEK